MKNIFKIFKRKPKPEYDPIRAFYTADVHSDKPIHFYMESTGIWKEYIAKPKFPPDRIEIH
jgi:hypothetical protein